MFGRTALLALVPLFHLLASSVTVEAVDVNDVTGTQLVKMCHTQLDFSLVVDESGSIIKEHWEKLIPFLRKIIESLNLDTSDIRLSLTTFSTPVRSIFTFLDKASYDTKTALQMVDEVYKSRPTSGMTYTGQALNFVRNFVLPLGRKHVPKAVLLITDGDSTDAGVTAQAAAMLRDDGVNVLVVGVGNINISECRGIVGCDARMDCPLFVHTEWGKMIELVNQLMREVCEVISEDAVCKPEWSEWSTCNAGCGQPGRKTRTLLSMETIKHATVGSNGQQGRTCKEQEDELISNSESCIGSCDDVNSHNYDTRPPEIGLSKPSDGSPNTPFHDANDRGRNEILGNGSSDGTPDGARYDSSSYPSDGNGSGNNGDSESSGGSGNGSGSLDYNAGGSESNYGNGSESSGGSGNGSGSWDYNAAGKKSFNRRMNGESNWNYNAAGKRSWDRSIDGESSWGGTGTGNMNWDYNAGGSGSNGGIPSNTPFSDALATSGNNDSQPDGSPEKLPGRRNYDDPEEYLPNEDGDGRGGKNGDGNDTTDDDKTASTNGESVIGNDSHVASQDSDDKEEDTHDIVKDGDDNIRKPGAREYDDSDEYLDDELGDWLYRKPEEDEQENGNDQGDEGDRSAPRHADDVYANSLLPNGGDEAGKDASGSNSREGVNLRDASGKGASNEYSTTNAEAKADGADESGGSSSGSNGAKIAGGVILGLLLLGAGGGYAAYKYKGSSSTTGNQDYTGADESAAPLSDAETYEVAEFDNNIWGETT